MGRGGGRKEKGGWVAGCQAQFLYEKAKRGEGGGEKEKEKRKRGCWEENGGKGKSKEKWGKRVE